MFINDIKYKLYMDTNSGGVDMLFKQHIEDGIYTIPNNINKIADGVYTGYIQTPFEGELILPMGLKSIGYHSFEAHPNLTMITIPSSVETIDETSFDYCSAITTITINKPQDSISGAPWGATNATVIWNG